MDASGSTETALEPYSLPRLLFLFLKIGTIGFGGGMAVIALIERELIEKRKLVRHEEFLHGIGLSQVLGSFAVNAAFFVGWRVAGVLGGLLSALVFLFPSLVLVTALSHFYFRYHAIPAMDGAVAGLGPVVIALILDAGLSIARRALNSRLAYGIAAAALALGLTHINVIWLLLAAGIAGLVAAARREPAQFGAHRAVVPLAFAVPVGLPLLASTFLKLGLVFFGGGFVLVPMLHNRLVTELGWLTPREFMDGVAISNLTPGPIAVLSTFAGYQQGGVAGALVATFALLLPSLILMIVITRGYGRYAADTRVRSFLGGVNPAVAGLILSAAVLLGPSALTTWREWLLTALAFFLLRRFRCHPAVVLGLGAAGGYFHLLR